MSSLVYLFILNEPGFAPFGINFSDDLDLSFDGRSLSIALANDLYRNVLGPHVENINVIAGENGVGKSTLLKAIASILAADPEVEEFEPERQFLLVYRIGPERLLIADNVLLEEDHQLSIGLGLQHYTFEKLGGQRVDLRRSLIYYSPFLDFNLLNLWPQDEDDETRLFDISQTAVLTADLEDNEDRLDMTAPILFHKFKNTRRQIAYVNDHREKLEVPFDLPKTIDLSFNRLKADKDDISTPDGIVYDKLQEYCALQLRQYPENKLDRETVAKVLFLRNLVTMYFLAINADKSQQILSHRLPEHLQDYVTKFENDSASRLINLLQTFFKEQDVFAGMIFNELIRIVFKIIDEEKPELYFMSANNQLSLRLDTHSPGIRELFEMLSPRDQPAGLYNTVYPAVNKLISFEWRNLSSGEKMFLDLFSRISSLRNRIPAGQPVLVVLDEAEIGFHPSWQLKYVKLLRDFFDQSFDGRPVQLLLATHSPLVLSDLPRGRVHLFRRSAQSGLTEKAPSIGTFAQNVSSLLANEFFIETALVGDLAKSYIDQILAALQNPETPPAYLAAAISLIDEPLIRQLLTKELESRGHA